MPDFRLLANKKRARSGIPAVFVAESLQSFIPICIFSLQKTNTKNSYESQNVNTRSLSTFDSSVSCLYFFDSEYVAFTQVLLPSCEYPKKTASFFCTAAQTALTNDVKKQQK